MGARPLRRAIQRLLEDEIAEQILEGRWHAGSVIDVDFVDGKLVFSEGEGEIPAPRKRDSMRERPGKPASCSSILAMPAIRGRAFQVAVRLISESRRSYN